MRKALVVLLLTVPADVVAASDLLVKIDHHYVARESDMTPMPVVFVDEHLVATLKLDVYTVPGMPSSTKSIGQLTRLDESSWLAAVRWVLADSADREIPLAPLILDTKTRHIRRRC